MIDQVRPAQWQDWRARQTGPVLVLDVRERWEIDLASIAPADCESYAIPLGQIQTLWPALRDTLGPEHTVACLCHHGVRSQRVAQFLQMQGLTRVVNIAGGIDAWSHEVDPGVPVY